MPSQPTSGARCARALGALAAATAVALGSATAAAGVLPAAALAQDAGGAAPSTGGAAPETTGGANTSDGAAAPGAGIGPSPLAASTPRRAYVQGDSLAVGTESRLPARLRGWRIRQSAASGRTLAQGLKLIRWRERKGSLDPVLVLSLGTNDDPMNPEGFRENVRAALDAAGDGRCVVWANVVRPRVKGHSYAALNSVLADEAAKRPNVVIVDWAAMTANHTNWLMKDRVHATTAGYNARANALAAGVRWCVGEPTGWWSRYLIS